jgi:hypothetical protein
VGGVARIMILTFGLALDGYKPRQPYLNHQVCGSAGLVKVLELRLGLAAWSFIRLPANYSLFQLQITLVFSQGLCRFS